MRSAIELGVTSQIDYRSSSVDGWLRYMLFQAFKMYICVLSQQLLLS